MNRTENLMPERAERILIEQVVEGHISDLDFLKAMRMGAEAIKHYLIAERPIDDESDETIFSVHLCPNCGESLEDIKALMWESDCSNFGDHCPCCGQKIDWSKADENTKSIRWYGLREGVTDA